MRLWHESLIPYLPRQQLLGQHRECCALRGNGWGKSHATVNYVFTHPRVWLWAYHRKVLDEMLHRGYHPDIDWMSMFYRGKYTFPDYEMLNKDFDYAVKHMGRQLVYPEHNDAYLKECIQNLQGKGVDMNRAIKDLGVIL